jgi:hypothetical protein
MTTQTLEERVAALERTVTQLVARTSADNGRKDWRSTIGMFTNDPIMKQIDEEGRRIREADRAQSRRQAEEDPS